MDKFVTKRPRTQVLDEIVSSSDESDASASKCPSKKIIRKFKHEWSIKYTWLTERNGLAFCLACGKNLSNHFAHIKRHSNNTLHLKSLENKKNQIHLEEMLPQPNASLQKQILDAEMALVMFCINHNLAIRLMDFLPALLLACCPDSKIAQGIKCGRTKTTQILAQLSKISMQNILPKLRTSKFSIIIDETTDLSCKTCLVIVVRYIDKMSFYVRDRFLAFIELEKADAEAIYTKLKDFFASNEIPLKNLIGLATDGASTMAGNLNSVKTKLLNVTNLFYIKCTCHSLHLCSSYACKTLPNEIEQFCRNVYKFFAYSPKRVNEFKEFQEYCNVRPHKILGISLTRWLALEGTICRIIEQWQPLQLYFISNTLEVNGIKATELAETMSNPDIKLFMLFLVYILKILNDLNKEFQSEEIRLPFLYEILEMNFKLILSNYMKIRYVKNTDLKDIDIEKESAFLPAESIFIGNKAEQFIHSGKFSHEQELNLKSQIRSFYIELLRQIKKRFDFDKEDIKNLRLIIPNQVFCESNNSIMPLINEFQHLVESEQTDNILNQWNLLRLSNNEVVKSCKDILSFWEKVASIKNGLGEFIFKDLSDFVLNLICLPHSSAAAERTFFQLSLIKNKLRNKLEFSTINHIMLCKELCTNARNVQCTHYVWSAKELK